MAGHYLHEGKQLQVTLEAVDVENNRTVWRDSLTVATPDLLAMREQMTAKVQPGVLPALGVATNTETGTRPKNEEAYQLYLRSAAVSHDSAPNKGAVAMLERSVALDPNYAPRGRRWGCGTTTTRLIPAEGRRCSRVRMKHTNTPWRWILSAWTLGQSGRSANLDRIAHDTEAHALSGLDPEPLYDMGSILAFCGKEEQAVRILGIVIQQNYCASDALRFDPVLTKLRTSAEFPALQAAAQECQRRFQEARSQGMH